MKRFALATGLKRFLFCAILVFGFGGCGWPLPTRAATIVVTNNASSGAGTLLTALSNARNGDVITFAVTGFITNRTTGGLTIRSNISIVGPGSDLLTITGTNWFSAFQVNNGATSSITGLTFYRCTSAINNSANLTVSNCVFTGCYKGGGIGNSGNLTIIGCTFTDCRGSYGLSWADFPDFATPGAAGTSGNNGGAIVNSGSMTALNCQFLNNFSGVGGDGASGDVPLFHPINYQVTTGGSGGSGGNGGAIYDTGTATFTNCTFSGNTSGGGGNGGVGASGGNTVVYVSSNPTYPGPGRNGGNAANAGNGSAVWSAGGIKFVGCTFYNNFAGPGGNGGNGGDAVMPNPGFYQFNGGSGGNAGNAGNGTLYCTGACQVIACTFFNNSMGSGGNGGNGGSGMNSAAFGVSLGSGANAGNGGSGGAVCGPTNFGGNFTLQNVLIAGNSCSYAGSPGSAGARVANASGLPGTNGLPAIDGTGPDLFGNFISRSHNFISLGDGSSGFTNSVKSDIVGSGSPLDAMLGALADNHGPVMTCALLAGSPALDAGDDTLLASNIVKDARGYARKSGAHVDIGAYEFQAPTPQFACRSIATENGVVISLTNTPGALFTLLGTTDLTLPVENWDVLGPMSETTAGQFEWTDADSFNYEFRFFSVRSP